ncbi:unnamed protein product [Mucor fragilis]
MSQHTQPQNYQAQQPLKLNHPTPYHLSALNNGNYANAPHPLADIDMQQQPQHQQLSPPYHTATRDPMSDHQQRNSIDFNDSFSQHIMHPMSDHDDHLEYQQNPSLYDRSSFSSAIDHHRRSSAATDISLQNAYHNQQPMFIPGGNAASLDSASHSLAMSAPANMYDYNSFHVAATAAGAGGRAQHDSLENGASGTSTSNSVAARSFEDDYQIQMNMQLMMEKRRRRRESHNAVERRRRDNINDRIQELCSLLPETALEGSNLGLTNKPNKGAILRKSVDHIKQLQQELSNYLVKVEELESTLKMYQQQGPAGPR